MSTLLCRARNGFMLVVVGLLCLSLIAPAVTLAGPDLAPGEEAVVANTNGDNATIQSDIGRDAAAISTVPEGTPVQITEGPLTAPDGTLWYAVVVDGVSGYIAADLLSTGEAAEQPSDNPDDSTDSTTETEAETTAVQGPAASTIPWKEPVAFGVVVNNTGAELPPEGITCRAEASAEAPIITELFEGNTLEVTGDETWVAGESWYPINCAGVGGFVSGTFVAVEESASTETEADTETEAELDAATEVVTETTTETDTAAETEVTTDEVTTETAVEEGSTEATTDTGSTEATEPVVDEVTTETTTETTSETAVVTEENAQTEGTDEGVDTATETDTDVPSSSEATTETDVAEEVETDTEGAQEVEETSEASTETEEVAVDVDSEATTDTGSSEPTTDESTETVTDTATGTETGTETETTSEPAPVDTPAEEAARSSAPETVEETTTEEETADTGSTIDESAAIGTAEVKGTGDNGLRCRSAADEGASTITVLAEGTRVLVMAEPVDGWLAIVCGGQLGYGDVRYLYSGGAVPGDFSADDEGSTVTVSGTGGAGLNCRTGASLSDRVITVLAPGASVTIRGVPTGNWLPVVCAGQNGYVSIDYVTAPAESGGDDVSAAAYGTGTVSGTGGDGVRCRTGAGTSYSIITVLAEGARVTVRAQPSGGWVPVVCANRNGYVHGDYLRVTTDDSSSSGETSGSTTSGTATVTGTGGSGLNCRSGPGTSYGVISVLREGSSVALRGTARNGWQPVDCGSRDGYASSQYLRISSSSGSDSGSNTGSDGSSGGTTVTGTATITGTGGDGVRCRSGAGTSYSIITVLREGTTVSVRGSASGDWVPVVCASRNGYVHGDFLTLSTGSGGTSGGRDSGGTTGLQSGDHAKTLANLNLRYEPSSGAGVAAVAPAGTVVLIRDSASNGYYSVDWDGLRGYMHGDYLAKSNAPLSERGGSAPTPDGGGSSGGGTATGNAIVDFAMGYLGYPYVWATHGPYSFDCSGFTYWVIWNVTGKNIWYGLWTQISAGTPVSRSNLQPGDLVFFQNTYKAGLSHVGIYIGGSKFIHASSPSTGVIISDLTSSYYSSRWYGARRIT